MAPTIQPYYSVIGIALALNIASYITTFCLYFLSRSLSAMSSSSATPCSAALPPHLTRGRMLSQPVTDFPSNSTTPVIPDSFRTSRTNRTITISTWDAWALPREILRHFPTKESSRLDPARFELQIKLLAFDRVDAAARLLKSLKKANFLGDTVSLEIFVDHPYDAVRGWFSSPPEKQQRKMAARREMLALADKFVWPHGPKRVHAREMNSGVQPQWMEAWWPDNVNQFAFVAEDDMEVSPLFYVYVKKLIWAYYYNKTNFDPSIFGISLQRQTLVPGLRGRAMKTSNEPYLYQLVGTWGQVLFPVPWKDFRMWYAERRFYPGNKPSLGGMKTTEYWERKHNNIWTPWQVQWAYAFHKFNLYPSFPGNLSLSVSHRSGGLNHRVSLGPDAQLIKPKDLPVLDSTAAAAAAQGGAASGAELPDWWSALPDGRRINKFDFCFRKIPNSKIPVRNIHWLRKMLPQFGAEQNLAVIPVPGTDAAYQLVRNWLCHVDGMDVHNYMFLFTKHTAQGNCLPKNVTALNRKAEELAKDLAARGHLVYLTTDLEQARNGTKRSGICHPGALKGMQESLLSVPQAQVVKQILDMGVNVLIQSLGFIWRRDVIKCLDSATLSGQQAPSVLSWVRARVVKGKKGELHIQSFASWVRSSAAGKGAYQMFLDILRQEGSRELAMLPQSVMAKVEKILAVRRVRAGDKKSASAPYGCISAARKTLASDVLPAGFLVDTEVWRLKNQSLWKLDSATLACQAVTCRKTK